MQVCELVNYECAIILSSSRGRCKLSEAALFSLREPFKCYRDSKRSEQQDQENVKVELLLSLLKVS